VVKLLVKIKLTIKKKVKVKMGCNQSKGYIINDQACKCPRVEVETGKLEDEVKSLKNDTEYILPEEIIQLITSFLIDSSVVLWVPKIKKLSRFQNIKTGENIFGNVQYSIKSIIGLIDTMENYYHNGRIIAISSERFKVINDRCQPRETRLKNNLTSLDWTSY
jgi:hypothetical protein